MVSRPLHSHVPCLEACLTPRLDHSGRTASTPCSLVACSPMSRCLYRFFIFPTFKFEMPRPDPSLFFTHIPLVVSSAPRHLWKARNLGPVPLSISPRVSGHTLPMSISNSCLTSEPLFSAIPVSVNGTAFLPFAHQVLWAPSELTSRACQGSSTACSPVSAPPLPGPGCGLLRRLPTSVLGPAGCSHWPSEGSCAHAS